MSGAHIHYAVHYEIITSLYTSPVTKHLHCGLMDREIERGGESNKEKERGGEKGKHEES